MLNDLNEWKNEISMTAMNEQMISMNEQMKDRMTSMKEMKGRKP